MAHERLTVGLVIDDSLDRPDGVQQHVLTLGPWLTAQGHEVHYLTSTTERTDLANMHSLGKNLRMKFNGNRLGTPLPAPKDPIRALLTDVNFDVLHVNMPYSPFLAGRVVDLAGPETAVVGTFHILPWSPLTRIGAKGLGLIQRRQLRRFARTIAVSAPAQAFAASALGLVARVIGNPVDVERFTSERDLSPRPAGAPVRIVFLGRLVERKGARELLEALAHLLALKSDLVNGLNLEIVIAGTGPLRSELIAFAESNGLAGLVSFPGYIAENDKAGLLASADIVALPSTGGESFGISVVEALGAARGVVIAGDNPGYRTVMAGLEDQLIDANDTPAFAALLAKYLLDDALRLTTAERQLAQAQLFDVDRVGREVVDVYLEAIAQTRATEV